MHLRASRLPGLTSGTGANTGERSGGAGSGGLLRGAGTGGRSGGEGSGGRLRGAGTGGRSGGAGSGGRLRGAGTGALRPLLWHNPRAILSSSSAAVQGAELLSALTLSVAFSLKAGVVAGSRTLTDVICSSGSVAILSSVALCGDGSSVAAGSGSPSVVGSGMCSVQRGDGGLATGSGVALARFSWEQAGNGDPFLTNVHSTKAVKFARGPSSDDDALYTEFKLAS